MNLDWYESGGQDMEGLRFRDGGHKVKVAWIWDGAAMKIDGR